MKKAATFLFCGENGYLIEAAGGKLTSTAYFLRPNFKISVKSLVFCLGTG